MYPGRLYTNTEILTTVYTYSTHLISTVILHTLFWYRHTHMTCFYRFYKVYLIYIITKTIANSSINSHVSLDTLYNSSLVSGFRRRKLVIKTGWSTQRTDVFYVCVFHLRNVPFPFSSDLILMVLTIASQYWYKI